MSVIKVKSCNALVCMLLVYIRIYPKSVLIYKFLILDTCHLDTSYTSKDVSIRGYFSKLKGTREQKSSENNGLEAFIETNCAVSQC